VVANGSRCTLKLIGKESDGKLREMRMKNAVKMNNPQKKEEN